MKKFIKVVLDVFIYACLIWAILSAVYMGLEPETQALFPQMNWLVALIGGGSTFLIGVSGFLVKAFLNKASNQTQSTYTDLLEKFLTITKEYEALDKSQKITAENIKKLEAKVEENTRIQKANLELKLSSPYIEEKSRKLVEGYIKGADVNDGESE